MKIENLAKIGELYGYTVYLDSESKNAGDARKHMEIESARKYLEQSFKNDDFITMLKDIFKS